MAFGRRYGLVGRNGTGKTTLLRAMAQHQIKGIPENCQILHVEQEVSHLPGSIAVLCCCSYNSLWRCRMLSSLYFFFLVLFFLFLFFLLGFQLHSCFVTLPSVLALLHAFHSSLLLPHLLRPLPLLLLGFPVVLPCASRQSNVSCTVLEIVQMFIVVQV